MASLSSRLFALSLLGWLAACGADEGDWRVNQRLVVERRPVSLSLAIQDDTVIRPEDMSRLQSFVDIYFHRGEAPLSLSVARGEEDESGEIAKQRAAKLAELLNAMGIEPDGIRVSTAKAALPFPEGSARLGYDVYAVRVPQCGDWSDNSSFSPLRNDPSPSFGCSVTRNIGLMVDNPRDLIRPHAMDGRDATRGATIIGKYRAGEDTVSKGTVSSTISSVGAK
jgi:pilus assembly protein CpaD